MRRNNYIIMTLLVLLMTACEKEIDIDYRSVDPLYVTEATVTPKGSTVRITTTRPVQVNEQEGIFVEDAVVNITVDDMTIPLEYNKNERVYESSLQAVQGATYHLDVAIGDKHYTSSSTVMSAPKVINFRFVRKKMMGEKLLFADLHLQDVAGENNYYMMHLYRNNIGYRWAVMRDDENPGGELTQLFSCSAEQSSGDSSEGGLSEGDVIRVEVRSIDKASYEYFYSLQLAVQSNTNPLYNISGGMLGYFSAYQYEMFNRVFHTINVEDEE